MGESHQISAGIWVFGQFIDRYATDGYGPEVGTLEAIDRAGRVDELVALDINYPFAGEGVGTGEVRERLESNGLRASVITPAIYTRRFSRGSFTNPDPEIRRETYSLVSESVEVAAELGADYVKFWPGQDGHDYPFQADYRNLWQLEIGGVSEVAKAYPDTQFAIEYKLKEPRFHMLFGTAARTLLAIEDMEVSNVGIVLDMGHSLFAKETPADVLHLIAGRGKLVGVEVNDNYREWDDDMTVASLHVADTLEFMLALRQIRWDGLVQLDQFPFREDPVRAASTSIATIRRLERVLERLDEDALAAAQEAQDALAAQALVESAVYGDRGLE